MTLALPPHKFRNPVHCAGHSADGFVYVCDRPTGTAAASAAEGVAVDANGVVYGAEVGSKSLKW